MVVLVHKYVQQAHLLGFHLGTLRYIQRLLNALNGYVNFLIKGDTNGGKHIRKIVNRTRYANK